MVSKSKPLLSQAHFIAAGFLVTIFACPTKGNTPNEVQDQEELQVRELVETTIKNLKLDDEMAMPMCGIYGVARAFELSGKSIELKNYLTRDFLSSDRGSSPAELIRMVELEGGRAFPLVNLFCWEIKNAGMPFIANVRSSRQAKSFDHWVCIVYHGNKILIFDGHRPGITISETELSAIWNGYGIFVDADPATSRFWFLIYMWLLRIFYLIFVLALLTLFLLGLKRRVKGGFLAKAGSYVGLTTCVVLVQIFVFSSPSQWSASMKKSGISGVRQWGSFVSLDELQVVANNKDVLLIDCRYASSFKWGSIPGAINIPIGISDYGLDAVFQKVSAKTPVVLFCESAQCSFSEIMANRIHDLGFLNVRIAEKGMREYREFASSQVLELAPKEIP